MEYLINQTSRVRFSGQKSTESPGSTKERKVSFQKTSSFKEEKKKSQNWFRRQISRQMNQDYGSNGIERATAVAAAVYAVASLEESTTKDQKKIGKSIASSLSRGKSRKEEKITVSTLEPGESSSRIPEIKVSEGLESANTGSKTPVKVVGPVSSMKKAPTFTEKHALSMEKIPSYAEKQLSGRDDIKSATPKQKSQVSVTKPAAELPKPERQKSKSPVIKPETEIPKPERQKSQLSVTEPETEVPKSDRRTPTKEIDWQTSTKREIGTTEADAWERDEQAKIKKKYDELEARILSWENKKKAKSRQRLNKSESELERRRLKSFERFRSEVEDINQIAEGARSKARKEQQNEELKAKEKANKYRETGKIPTTCFCF